MKTNRKKIAVILVMVLALAAAAWWFIRQRRAKTITNDPTGKSPGQPFPAGGGAGTSANQGTKPPASGDFPIGVGSRGKYVTAIQQLLKDKGQKIAVDGIFGPKTKEALTRVFKIYSVQDIKQFNGLFGK